MKRSLRLLPEGLHYLFDIERLPRHNRNDRGVRNVSVGWVSLSHVPANPDKSRIGGIVPPALRASIHSLLAGVTSAVPGIIRLTLQTSSRLVGIRFQLGSLWLTIRDWHREFEKYWKKNRDLMRRKCSADFAFYFSATWSEALLRKT